MLLWFRVKSPVPSDHRAGAILGAALKYSLVSAKTQIRSFAAVNRPKMLFMDLSVSRILTPHKHKNRNSSVKSLDLKGDTAWTYLVKYLVIFYLIKVCEEYQSIPCYFQNRQISIYTFFCFAQYIIAH